MTLTQLGRTSEIRSARRLIQVAGFIFYVLAVQGLCTAGVGIYVFLQGGSTRDLVLPLTGGVLALCYAAAGYFLRRYRLWARNFAFAFAAVGVFFFSIGTVLGSVIVVCIDRANRAGLFPSRRAPQPPPAEAEEAAPPLTLQPDLSAETAR